MILSRLGNKLIHSRTIDIVFATHEKISTHGSIDCGHISNLSENTLDNLTSQLLTSWIDPLSLSPSLLNVAPTTTKPKIE